MAMDLKGTSLLKKRTVYNKGLGVEVIIEIAWELDEGYECGTKYAINFCKISGPLIIDKSANSMISVDIEPYRKPYKRN